MKLLSESVSANVEQIQCETGVRFSIRPNCPRARLSSTRLCSTRHSSSHVRYLQRAQLGKNNDLAAVSKPHQSLLAACGRPRECSFSSRGSVVVILVGSIGVVSARVFGQQTCLARWKRGLTVTALGSSPASSPVLGLVARCVTGESWLAWVVSCTANMLRVIGVV